MNHIGTHDTERALTLLAGEPAGGRGRDWQAEQRLSGAEYRRGVKLLKLASLIQYTLPGVPCLYYGDEAGMQGYRDPFNRRCYPWGHEDAELLNWYRWLGQFRKNCKPLKKGGFAELSRGGGYIAYKRTDGEDSVSFIINRNEYEVKIMLDKEYVVPATDFIII